MTTELKVLKQGAEAKLYICTYLGKPALIKDRFPKGYRHPDLDNAITKERIKCEARGIVRCKIAGILTPTLYLVDFDRRRIYMQHFEKNITIKDYIANISKYAPGTELESVNQIAVMIGNTVGKLHCKNMIHGDLTTSNMLLVQKDVNEGQWIEKKDFNIALIDFGLSAVDTTVEDKGVDLYVLERSFISSHSEYSLLMSVVLDEYKTVNDFQIDEVLNRYEAVRERGRKRNLIG